MTPINQSFLSLKIGERGRLRENGCVLEKVQYFENTYEVAVVT